jgi:hypothetical protein
VGGQAMAAWTQHTMSFAAADAAARAVHASVQHLRKLAVQMLFGMKCPEKVAQGIIQLPIQKGALFGPRMTAEIQQLASHQATSSLVSSALVSMGGGAIPQVAKHSSSQSKRGAGGGRFRGGKASHRGGHAGQSRGGKTHGGQSGQSRGGKSAGTQGSYQQGRGKGARGGKSQRFRGGRGGGRGRGRGGGGEGESPKD